MHRTAELGLGALCRLTIEFAHRQTRPVEHLFREHAGRMRRPHDRVLIVQGVLTHGADDHRTVIAGTRLHRDTPLCQQVAQGVVGQPFVELAVRIVPDECGPAALAIGGGRPVPMLDIAPSTQKAEAARAAQRFPFDRRVTEVAADRARLPDGLEPLLGEIAATQLGHAGHRGRWIHAPIGRDTQAGPARAGQIVLHTWATIESQPELLDVVDRHPERGCHDTRRSDGGEDLLGGRQVTQSPVEDTAPPVGPQQVDVTHIVGRRQPDDLVERAEVVPQDGRGQRRPQTGGDGEVQTLHDAFKGSGPSDPVINLDRRAVQADLDAQSPSTGRGRTQPTEALQAVALEQGAVGQNDELSAMGRNHALREIENVRPGQRLAAGEEQPFSPESHRLVDRIGYPGRRQPLLTLGSGRHQTVTAAQVAEVVDLDPQLLQPFGLQIG